MYVFGSISHAYFEYSWHMHVCMYLPIPNMHTLNISGTCVYLWVPNVHGCAAVCIPLKSAALVSPLSAFHECCLTQASRLLCMVGAWRCVLLTYIVFFPGDFQGCGFLVTCWCMVGKMWLLCNALYASSSGNDRLNISVMCSCLSIHCSVHLSKSEPVSGPIASSWTVQVFTSKQHSRSLSKICTVVHHVRFPVFVTSPNACGSVTFSLS